MSHSPEQCRKKEEAMREAEMHQKHDTVDGSKARNEHSSHMAHMGNAYERNMERGQ
jgi:hypothetical protein